VSVQFGRWSLDGRPPDREYLSKAEGMLAPYGPDGLGTYIKDSIGILFRAFHTTIESRRESQPFVTPSGAVLTWDGRLDNRAELIGELGTTLTTASTDASIVAAAYERWGTASFANLIGDWALSIWNPMDRSLILAKDPIGTRHLYYSFDKDQVTWSTTLDPLVLLEGKTFPLEEEYIAGWLSFFPATYLTPYVGIHAVPPSCFVRLERGRKTIRKYWDFDPSKKIRYRTEGEYEERFRTVFGEAVRRRLRSDSPVLAELSGGMDSSSIVCMADTIIATGVAETPWLDTISYFDDSEPNWNEKPFFQKVEEKRGREGFHIDIGTHETFRFEFARSGFAATPCSAGRSEEARAQFEACLVGQGNRVVLSGIGGDEVTGGVPTPLPELMDLIARARFKFLAHQLKVWALNKRKPWFYLLFEAIRGFLPPALVGIPKRLRPAPWVYTDFVKRQQAALTGYAARVKLFGPRPSFQGNVATLEALRRQLTCTVLPLGTPYEKRYPYLDRDLLECLYAMPPEQFSRPGQRRSLMRRALVGIVPEALLNRRRKAFAARAPMTVFSSDWSALVEISQAMKCASRGIVDAVALREAVQRIRAGRELHMVALFRTLGLESWLRTIEEQRAPSENQPMTLNGTVLPLEKRCRTGHSQIASSAS